MSDKLQPSNDLHSTLYAIAWDVVQRSATLNDPAEVAKRVREAYLTLNGRDSEGRKPSKSSQPQSQ